MPRDTPEIGPERVRRKRASDAATPIDCPPASANTEIGGGNASGDDGAKPKPTPGVEAPRIPNNGPASDDGTGGEGQGIDDPHMETALATPPIRAICGALRELQKQRQLAITETNGSTSRIEHLIAGTIGYGGTEKSKKKAFTAARTFRLAMERGGEGQDNSGNRCWSTLSPLAPVIVQSANSRAAWPTLRAAIESQMKDLAKQLPGQELVASAKGFDHLGYAVIQGRLTHPIGDYRTVSGLWKSLGVAVIDGKRQQGVSGKRKDDAEAMKFYYPKQTRAEVYVFLSDTMLRAQWRAERLSCESCGKPAKFEWVEGVPVCEKCGARGSADAVILAHAVGHYGEIYGRRKAHTGPRCLATDSLDIKDPEKWTPARCDKDARRIMSKALLRDLWRAWRGLPPRGFGEE